MPIQKNRRNFCKSAIALTAAMAAPTAVFAKTVNRFSLSKSGHALKGYDTTAYFSAGKPARGKDALTVNWKGATWRFASEKEASLFRANPEA